METRVTGFVVLALAWAYCCASPAFAAEPAKAPPTYAQVHAIFAKHCLSCHDSKEADGELVLESHESLLKGGDTGKAIVPGKSGDSLLVKLIERTEKPFMPPPKKGDKLSDAEIGIVRAWIDAGALPGETSSTPAVVLPKIAPRQATRSSINALAAAATQKRYAVGLPGVVELRSLENRSLVRKLEGHTGNVNDVVLSNDRSILVAAGGTPGASGEVKIWRMLDGTLQRTIVAHADAIYSVAISADGKTLATGSYDQQTKLWDVANGNEMLTLTGHNGCVFDLAFRPDGKVLASSSADRTVKLWDVATGARLDTLTESLKELHAVAFSPTGDRVFAAGVDNRIRVWAVSASAKEGTNKLLQSVFAHEGAILRLAFSPDGNTLASSAEDGTVKLWNPADVTLRHVLPKQPDWPTALALTNDVLLVGRLDGSLDVYETASGKAVMPPKPELTSAEPRAVQRGATTALKLSGRNLASMTGVKSPAADVALKVISGLGTDELTVEAVVAPNLKADDIQIMATGPAGDSAPLKLSVDKLPQSVESEPNDAASQAVSLPALPASAWGKFAAPGDADYFAFDAKAGQPIVIDLAARRFGSKADAVLTLLDAAGSVLATNNDADGTPDPLLAFTPPVDGRYVVRVHELQIAASATDHFYRLSVGSFPLVTGVFPLGVPANSETRVELLGYNLPAGASATVKAGAAADADRDKELDVPLDRDVFFRMRREPKVLVNAAPAVLESEPNDKPEQATPLAAPGVADGRLASADPDLFRFDARKGQTWIVETIAQRRGSPADTKIEILDGSGKPVPRVLLRAVRDSYLEFRPMGPNDIGGRFKNWEEMELNEYLYMNGEVVKLFLYPRGPDSQWDFYVSGNPRRCYFDTSAASHAIDEPCYIVEPLPPGSSPAPNGLPTFLLNYANDDDQERKLGADSRLTFTAPADGSYLVRVTDTRGGPGSERHAYRLVIREARPDFNVKITPDATAVPPGTGVGFTVRADRIDNFEDEIRVELTGLPPGFSASTPIVIQAGHEEARGTLRAAPDAPQPTTDASAGEVKITATATVAGKPVTKDVKSFGKLTLGGKPSVTVSFDVTETAKPRSEVSAAPAELTIAPGQTVSAWLSCARDTHKGLVSFDVQNLPHGIIVADIGLNGVLIPEGESRRQIFLTCAPWVPEQERLAFARAREAGNPTSAPVLVRVRKPQK